jgi:hypothetical protein
MIQTKDIYWLAGLLEGEGCFQCQMRGIKRRRSLPTIIIAMSDRDVIERVRMLTAAPGRICLQANPGRKQLFRLTIAGRKAVGLMMTIYCLMGERRKSRIREVIQDWNQYAPRGKWPRRVGYRHGDGMSRAA